MEETIDALHDRLASALGAGPASGRLAAVDQALGSLLTACQARATGLWHRQGDVLCLLGFAAVSDMPQAVQSGFATATANVSLSQTGLGIVAAALNRRLMVANVQGVNDLHASAGWIQRFEARQSLSVPVLHEGAVAGVLAVATGQVHEPGSPPWRIASGLAERLGPVLAGLA